jgi:hypothetical protein
LQNGRVATYLQDIQRVDRGAGLEVFLETRVIAQLGWPRDVVSQWLFDHGRRPAFNVDYGHVDLSHVRWCLEAISVEELIGIPTGPSDAGLLEEVAADHEHYLGIRPPEVRNAWEELGTWLVPPVLIARGIVEPTSSGLQVVEGRWRVGILRGRRAAGSPVNDLHHAWVGRAA